MLQITNQQERMISACGIDCSYCYAHLKKKKPCPGCRLGEDSKPEHCRKCKMKDCVHEKDVLFCSDCIEYPCLLIKRLDKSYRMRYKESLINNMRVINDKGMDYYLKFEKERLKCPECGGILTIHHKKCSDCGKIFEVHELR